MGAVPPTAPQNGPSRGRVLVVDDDAALAEMLGIVLRREGYEPAFVSDGNRAVGVFQQTRPDLVLLDLMLPGRNGLQICQDIRTQSTVPIVMLTAKGDTIDVVQGLEAGADDYVTKPFKPVELVARVRAQLRRGETGQAENLAIGDVQIDVPAHQVTRDGVAIPLTPLEFDLLVALARKPRQVFTRELLLEQVWGYRHAADTRLVNVHVQRLRAKIEQDPEKPEVVLTVRGVGYKAGPALSGHNGAVTRTSVHAAVTRTARRRALRGAGSGARAASAGRRAPAPRPARAAPPRRSRAAAGPGGSIAPGRARMAVLAAGADRRDHHDRRRHGRGHRQPRAVQPDPGPAADGEAAGGDRPGAGRRVLRAGPGGAASPPATRRACGPPWTAPSRGLTERGGAAGDFDVVMVYRTGDDERSVTSHRPLVPAPSRPTCGPPSTPATRSGGTPRSPTRTASRGRPC